MEVVSNLLFMGMHLALLLAFVVRPSWRVLVFAAASYGIRMWAVTAGYHRYFAHRSYKTSRAFQLLLALSGATTMQNGPIWWASVHRRHHRFADTAKDPHSPVGRGAWYAHIGWNFDRTRARADERSNVRDLEKYPELRFVDDHDWIPLMAYAGACFAVGGLPGLVWGFVVSTMAVFHGTMLINSLGHVWGSRRYETSDRSRNNILLALLTLGEGWHNNHHHCMSSARQGFYWWELDVTYYLLRALALMRIVWDVRTPTAAALLAVGTRRPRTQATPPEPEPPRMAGAELPSGACRAQPRAGGFAHVAAPERSGRRRRAHRTAVTGRSIGPRTPRGVLIVSAPRRSLPAFRSEKGAVSEVAQMAEGTIKRVTDKGFGFIDTGKGQDLFFHMSSVQGVRFEDLRQGQRVSFTEGQGPKGPRAENVKPI